MTKPDWEKAVESARTPLPSSPARSVGDLRSGSARRPGGEYVVIQFDAQFENRNAAVETVTPMREKDGSWRVSGYYIK